MSAGSRRERTTPPAIDIWLNIGALWGGISAEDFPCSCPGDALHRLSNRRKPKVQYQARQISSFYDECAEHLRLAAKLAGPMLLRGGNHHVDCYKGRIVSNHGKQYQPRQTVGVAPDLLKFKLQWGSATKNTMGYLKTGTSSDPGKVAFLGSFWEDFPGSSLNLGHGIGKSH